MSRRARRPEPETLTRVRIVRLTRIRSGPEGQARWRVVLSDGTEATTATGAPGITNINSPDNGDLVDVELNGRGNITRVTRSPGQPARRR